MTGDKCVDQIEGIEEYLDVLGVREMKSEFFWLLSRNVLLARSPIVGEPGAVQPAQEPASQRESSAQPAPNIAIPEPTMPSVASEAPQVDEGMAKAPQTPVRVGQRHS